MGSESDHLPESISIQAHEIHIGFAVLPDEQASSVIEASADKRYRERMASSPLATNATMTADTSGATTLLKDECWLASLSEYVSQARLVAVEFAMRDNFGKWWHAERTMFRLENDGNVQPGH